MTVFFEKMATRETGRLSVSIRETADAILVVYPENLKYAAIISRNDSGRGRYFIQYTHGGGRSVNAFRQIPVFLWRLLKILPACKKIEMYLLSPRIDGPFILAAAALARLFGRPVSLHDYRFRTDQSGRTEGLLRSLCRGIVYGDISAFHKNEKLEPGISFRFDLIDFSFYRRLQKQRAVPQVLVYGDFSNEKTLTLIRRTHDLVKQKYPRTEFVLISPLASDGCPTSSDSLKVVCPDAESDLRALFASSDILMMMSPGGVNRLFGARAAAAGYPVITNGFEYPIGNGVEPVMAARDSYSVLADAVTRMVDDENYYRSFSRS